MTHPHEGHRHCLISLIDRSLDHSTSASIFHFISQHVRKNVDRIRSPLFLISLNEEKREGQQKTQAKLKFRHLKHLNPLETTAPPCCCEGTANHGHVLRRRRGQDFAAFAAVPQQPRCHGGRQDKGERKVETNVSISYGSVDLVVLHLCISYVHTDMLFAWICDGDGVLFLDEGDLRGGSYIRPSTTETFTIQVFPQDSANTCLSSQAKVELPFLPMLSYPGLCRTHVAYKWRSSLSQR